MKISTRILLLTILLFSFIVIKAQDDEYWSKYTNKEVEVANPVYKPVISVGVGILNFKGDIKNISNNILVGKPALKINASTFIDSKNRFRLNFNGIILGKIEGSHYSYKIPADNINFQSEILAGGINLHYDFDPLFNSNSIIRPFISLGVEFITFNTTSDLYRIDKIAGVDVKTKYNYWTDGTIRDKPQNSNQPSRIIKRDYIYDTDIVANKTFTSEIYNQYTIGIPAEIGIDFKVSNRFVVRVGTSYHQAFSDYLDGISTTTNPKGKKGNDAFLFTYTSFHFDLFSDPKTLLVRSLFAEIDDQDLITFLYGDEDNDGAFDAYDNCLQTPSGIEVDSVGCPLDQDMDGVADYLDKEANTAPDAIVDREGKEISDDAVWTNLNAEGIERSQVEIFLSIMNNLGASGRRNGNMPIPDKFKSLDIDGDNYISFDEVLKSIDDFFDFNNELSTQDIYELNEFFFSQ